nr:FMN-binding negative transcriptional regulator [Bacillus pakistanensis]
MGFCSKKLFWHDCPTERGKSIATHLPLGLNKKGDDYYITGHMANGNPQWRCSLLCFRDRMLMSLLPGIRTLFVASNKKSPNY